MLIALILILACNIGLLTGVVYVHKRIGAALADYKNTKQSVQSIFLPTSEGDVTPFGEILDAAAKVIAEHMGVTVTAAIRGSIGGSMKGVNRELEEIAIQENPSLALAEALPKSLKKNPLALAGLQAIMSKMAQGGAGQAGGNGRRTSQPRFNL